jgi:hypothetical protein
MNNSFIHEHSKTTQSEINNYYSTINSYDFIDEENNPRIKKENDQRVLAKAKSRPDSTVKYLIKLDNMKNLYNPLLPLSENKQSTLYEDKAYIPFKEVSKPVFDMYITFLRTLNPVWIRNAEREGF